MRLALGMVAGISLAIILYAMRQPTLDMIFMRDQPGTPDGWAPKTWTSHAGVIVKGPWT